MKQYILCSEGDEPNYPIALHACPRKAEVVMNVYEDKYIVDSVLHQEEGATIIYCRKVEVVNETD